MGRERVALIRLPCPLTGDRPGCWCWPAVPLVRGLPSHRPRTVVGKLAEVYQTRPHLLQWGCRNFFHAAPRHKRGGLLDCKVSGGVVGGKSGRGASLAVSCLSPGGASSGVR